MHAARAVLPAMREARDGSIILINGGTSVKSRAGFAGTSIAFPAETAYGEMLHEALSEEGIRVRQLVIPGAIPRLRSRADSTTLPIGSGPCTPSRDSSGTCSFPWTTGANRPYSRSGMGDGSGTS
ncbi:hypothetical protein GCM10025876_02710 [Demequina litorisediminis]|uniref:Short chain dehydrogenase n=1 Tax=Demequina litorisediminis TaxID=1849022 RepID=A0ABQ6IA87_9MICO|nr:hypothetical protein GCM10025876_02710 [Demequina litorisediminis]